ncbi:MAG: ATP synthase F1 subunit gamma [Solirubrobacterales bacterium]|nr:ATP synthase F1 subunit gamma [Solirubrobacterales bacterium]
MATQKEVKTRIASVKNIRQITRAMEMVAAARLRRAEQRIAAMRPYAQAIRKMTQRVAEAAKNNEKRIPLLQRHGENAKRAAIVLVTGDRGLAGSFNSQIIRAGLKLGAEFTADGTEVDYYVVGRRGNSSLTFRGESVVQSFTGFTDRPAFADAREIGEAVTSRYVDEELDRVELIYNRYVSPLTQYVRRQTLLPLQEAQVYGEGIPDEPEADDSELAEAQSRSDWIYEPEPEEALSLLFSEYVNLSVYRGLLESTASEHGARMTAMRSAADNAGDMIDQLTLEMNRVRQAEITQEILEVVGGAEALGS